MSRQRLESLHRMSNLNTNVNTIGVASLLSSSLSNNLARRTTVVMVLSMILLVPPLAAFTVPSLSQNRRLTQHKYQHDNHKPHMNIMMATTAAAAAATTKTVDDTALVVAPQRRVGKLDDLDQARERFLGFASIAPIPSMPTDSTITPATAATTDTTTKFTKRVTTATATATSTKTRLKKQSIKRKTTTTSTTPKLPTTTTRTTRSSTMPGFSIPSQRQQSQARMLRRIEDPTQDHGPTKASVALQTRQRQTTAGDAMYQSSSSVPDSLMQFAKELRQEERISPSEEIQLGRLTQEAIQLQTLYDDMVTKLQREPTDEEWCAASGKINMEAIRQALEQGIEAKNKLVTSNLRLVQGVVNVYIRNGLSGQYNAGDMMQEGVMALIRAAEKFEPQRGFRFSTYAMYWIRSAVKRSQTFQSRVITIPQRLHANHKRVMLVQKEMSQALGRLPTNQELARAVSMSEVQLGRCLKAMEQRCFSLDQQITNRNKPNSNQREDSLYDVLESKSDDGGGDVNQRRFLREALTESLYRSLDRESAHIIMLRFGLVDPHILPRGYEGPLTIAQVSQLVGMKPDKVRRRILKSLKDLKFSMGSEWRDFERVVE